MTDAELALAAYEAAERMARVNEWCSPGDENLANLIAAVRATERARVGVLLNAVKGVVETDGFYVAEHDYDEQAQDAADRAWNGLMDAYQPFRQPQ